MHEPGHLLAVFLLNRNHKPAVTDSDDRLLQVFLIRCRADHRIEAFPNPLVRCAHRPANARKRRRSSVKDLILADDAAVDLLLNAAVRRQKTCHVVKEAAFVFLRQHLARNTRCPKAFRNAQKLSGGNEQRSMHPLQALPHIRKIVHRGLPGSVHKRFRFPCQGKLALHLIKIG